VRLLTPHAGPPGEALTFYRCRPVISSQSAIFLISEEDHRRAHPVTRTGTERPLRRGPGRPPTQTDCRPDRRLRVRYRRRRSSLSATSPVGVISGMTSNPATPRHPRRSLRGYIGSGAPLSGRHNIEHTAGCWPSRPGSCYLHSMNFPDLGKFPAAKGSSPRTQ
jgi:hypothetical protein